MKVFKTSQIREIDAYTIRNEPVSPADLMERAALGCVQWIEAHIPQRTPVAVFTGPGNNGGDGWVIARMLADRKFENILVFQLHTSPNISSVALLNRDRLISQGIVPVQVIQTLSDLPPIASDTVIIDALFGSGLTRPLEGLAASVVQAINNSGCRVVSIDIPSGLMGEDNSGNPAQGIVRASDTLTFQFPKRSFFYFENQQYCGNWHIIPIGLHPEALEQQPALFYFTTISDISCKLIKRPTFSHKGSYGHALLIAGSYGMMGAAILAARSCIRTGTGLLTTHIPKEGYPIIQASVPESIFSIDHSEERFTRCPDLENYNAIAAGPGIGIKPETATALEYIIRNTKKPLVLDADALNILALRPELLLYLPVNTIITPHPGEFDRLFGKVNTGFKRNELQIECSVRYKLIILLKGAYSSVSLPDGRCFFNSTGNPGMATAGSGDVLTGIVLSLLAQGYAPEDACIIAAFVHGLAGDLAAEVTGERGLTASDIIDYLNEAFKKIEHHETTR
jgi:ADP-dependent NAD(P)H-hydrate dehydratase / NAD(P)H-hydrate epimerase